MSEHIKPFKGQDYNQLKYSYNESHLFVDPYFAASDQSLCYSQTPPDVKWLRPKEVHPDAKFVVDDFERCDIDQGHLGNCWFIAGVVGIMQIPKVFAKVVPNDQSFDDDYCGMFHFRFWLYGEWVDVVVDDRLPYWPDGRLVYCSNKQSLNEYWCPLLEKAYAKLYGSCYEVLDAGQTYDALIDMSGGIQEQFSLKKLDSETRSNFWNILEKAFQKDSIMGCCIYPDPSVREARMSNGLVRGHAYTITKIVDLDSNSVKLLRIRNPWGNDVEWNGSWSDNSREWNSISESEKREIGLINEKDGEFWMSFTDFLSQWDNLQICHITAESYSDELSGHSHDHLNWKCTMYNSEWISGSTAGGSGNNDQAAFWTNPQFLITLTDVDDDDNENKCSIIVALMQKDSRLKRIKANQDSCEEFIQFKIFKIKDDVPIDTNKSTGLKLYSTQLDRIGASGSYINSREVTHRFRVDPGNYLIIPSTYEQNKDCEFLLRIYTQTNIGGGSLDIPKDDLDENDTYIDLTNEDKMFKKVRKYLDPKMAQFKKKIFGAHVETIDQLKPYSDDIEKLVDHIPEFHGSRFIKSGIKHGINSFFNS